MLFPEILVVFNVFYVNINDEGLRIWLRWVTNMAASGYEYGCIGLRIWLRWVTNMTASGYGYGCVG